MYTFVIFFNVLSRSTDCFERPGGEYKMERRQVKISRENIVVVINTDGSSLCVYIRMCVPNRRLFCCAC